MKNKRTIRQTIEESKVAFIDHQNGVWFTPGRGKRTSTGFLETRVKNMRKYLKRALQKSNSSSSSPPPPRQTTNKADVRQVCLPESTITEEKAISLKEWLKHNTHPLSQVEQYMRDTAVYRAELIRRNDWGILEIRQEFPHILTRGMVAQDFDILYGEAAPKLFETWLPVFAEKILDLARREGKLVANPEGLAPDMLSEIALSQLPSLLPPTVYMKNKKTIRHTIEESKVAFIDHQNASTNLVEYLEQPRASTEYPYVLSLGNNIWNPSQAFVILAGEAFEQNTLLQAVDVCFKMFYIFNIHYPKQCAAVWEFLQHAVYGMAGPESQPVTYLRLSLTN